MDKRYKVIFSKLLKEKDYFKGHMTMLGVSEETSEEILKKAPVILKKNLPLKDARRYADAMFQAGARVVIHPEDHRDAKGRSGIVTLKNFIMCPQCGHKQVKVETCIKCGFAF